MYIGKGTQCQLLAERLGNNNNNSGNRWVHLSAGDLLRAERLKRDSCLADEINACIAAGKLVASHVTCQLLEQAMLEAYHSQAVTHFLIDGFPRSRSNADAWEATMMGVATNSSSSSSSDGAAAAAEPKFASCRCICHVQAVLDFQCPEETLIGRLLERGKSGGRSDDNLATVKARFETFRSETAPILEYYRTTGSSNNKNNNNNKIPVHTIATDKPVEDVYRDTVKYFMDSA